MTSLPQRYLKIVIQASPLVQAVTLFTLSYRPLTLIYSWDWTHHFLRTSLTQKVAINPISHVLPYTTHQAAQAAMVPAEPCCKPASDSPGQGVSPRPPCQRGSGVAAPRILLPMPPSLLVTQQYKTGCISLQLTSLRWKLLHNPFPCPENTPKKCRRQVMCIYSSGNEISTRGTNNALKLRHHPSRTSFSNYFYWKKLLRTEVPFRFP